MIFFDLDGVLIDTEPLYSRFWREASEAFGIEMTYEQSLRMRSLDSGLAREHFRDLAGRDIYEAVREERKSRMEAWRREHPVRAKAGAAELLNWLRETGRPYYLVTASTSGRAGRYTKDAGLGIGEAQIISTKSVARGKPFPDVYLEACRIAGCAPEEAVAVEDSPNGLKSAHAAGCRTVMVPDLTEPTEEDLQCTTAVCQNLMMLKAYIEKTGC